MHLPTITTYYTYVVATVKYIYVIPNKGKTNINEGL